MMIAVVTMTTTIMVIFVVVVVELMMMMMSPIFSLIDIVKKKIHSVQTRPHVIHS